MVVCLSGKAIHVVHVLLYVVVGTHIVHMYRRSSRLPRSFRPQVFSTLTSGKRGREGEIYLIPSHACYFPVLRLIKICRGFQCAQDLVGLELR